MRANDSIDRKRIYLCPIDHVDSLDRNDRVRSNASWNARCLNVISARAAQLMKSPVGWDTDTSTGYL